MVPVAASGPQHRRRRGVPVCAGLGRTLGRLSAAGATDPPRYFVGLVILSAIAYVPLALAFTPWTWKSIGPFSLQLSRPLHYAVYFFAGVGIGAYGLERGLLSADGLLARHWRAWWAAFLAAFVVWSVPIALMMRGAAAATMVRSACRSSPISASSWPAPAAAFSSPECACASRGGAGLARQSVGQRLWHVSDPLRVRRLAAICIAGRRAVRRSPRRRSCSAER